jgi:nucleotide-binding universal stress UspA family protein
MYKHILVPLDESDLAESALQHAEALARCLGAKLTLIAIMPLGDESEGINSAALEARRTDLRTYLDSRCARLEEGMSCHASVREGDVAEEIAHYAEGHEVDLIVMATSGKQGLARWVHGSVADNVLARAPVPVLIVRAD